jgi:hypothetical protein
MVQRWIEWIKQLLFSSFSTLMSNAGAHLLPEAGAQ